MSAGRTSLIPLAVLLMVLMLLVTGCDDPDSDGSATGDLSSDVPGATADAGAGGSGSTSETGNETASTTSTDSDAAGAFLPLDPAKLGTVERDVTYGKAGGVDLKMDIYYPVAATGPAPVVMYVHGGGWTKGDKQDGAGAAAIPSLQEAGFLVVSVNYRLAPEYRFPAQIEDVKCAVRYLRANSGKYALDPGRIGAWGGSAGGHLVSLLGVMDDDDGLEGSCGNQDESSRVQAVVDMFGPSDLTRRFEGGAIGQTLGARVFGTSESGSEILKIASPVTYVTADDPPFLILQGDSDMLVPPDQSQGLYDLLKAADVPATLVMVENAGHAFVPQSGEIDPSRQEINAMIVDFFRRELM